MLLNVSPFYSIEYYHRHVKYGTAEVKVKHFLLLGPWDHSGTYIYIESAQYVRTLLTDTKHPRQPESDCR